MFRTGNTRGGSETLGNDAQVGVVGLGYVGLPTAVCFAAKGIPTIGVDVDDARVAKIAKGNTPIMEPRLPNLLSKTLRSGRLRVESSYDALSEADICFVTVGTPASRDGTIDLSHVNRAARSIGKILRHSRYKTVVIKSTVIPGTTGGIVKSAIESESHKSLGDFGLASNPEFLREGHSVEDTLRPDRIVIGACDKESERTLDSFYRRLYERLPKTILTTPVNAELIKYASNSFLATKITFINEFANLCAKIPGADVSVVARGIGLDKRIAPSFLRAGLGFGGSCLPKDLQALLKVAAKANAKLGVAAAARAGNERQVPVAVQLAERLIGSLEGKRIAILGLAFKPDSDDMREAVSLRLIDELKRRDAKVVAYDPAAIPNARKVLGETIDYRSSATACLRGADCCIMVTEWKEFSKLHPKHFEATMRTPAVVDGRRILDPEEFTGSGVRFAAIGLGQSI